MRAQIIPVVVVCEACDRPHNIGCTLLTPPGQLSPELRFTIPARCVDCGEPLNTPQHDDDIRDTVAALIWHAHHKGAA